MNQPGALNESFADVFGEFVDCRADNCTWVHHTSRDLSNPLNLGQHPDHVGDTGNPDTDHPLYITNCTPPACTPGPGNDYGGVHTNNGVPNIVAYLIVNGERHFPLDLPVINIGRRRENELTLNSRRVSRSHAQLRVRNGRFVLFDLNSTAGTKVNGVHVQQHILRAGDVISLSDVDLVYGEDMPTDPDSTLGLTPAQMPPEDIIP